MTPSLSKKDHLKIQALKEELRAFRSRGVDMLHVGGYYVIYHKDHEQPGEEFVTEFENQRKRIQELESILSGKTFD